MPNTRIHKLAKEPRRMDLQKMGAKLQLLAQMYGIEMRLGPEVLIERILDFEFAGSRV